MIQNVRPERLRIAVNAEVLDGRHLGDLLAKTRIFGKAEEVRSHLAHLKVGDFVGEVLLRIAVDAEDERPLDLADAVGGSGLHDVIVVPDRMALAVVEVRAHPLRDVLRLAEALRRQHFDFNRVEKSLVLARELLATVFAVLGVPEKDGHVGMAFLDLPVEVAHELMLAIEGVERLLRIIPCPV